MTTHGLPVKLAADASGFTWHPPIPTGSFHHPEYGKFEVRESDLQVMVTNRVIRGKAGGEAFQGFRVGGKAPLLDHLAGSIQLGGKNELLVDVEADIMLVGHNDPPIGKD